ncbi:MAG: DUF4180 domain-containing protein [Terracidiphilus sp.]
MAANSYDLHGVRIFECPSNGPAVQSEQDALGILGEAMAQQAEMVMLPVDRLSPSFFELRTGLAGAIAQKFVTYGMRLAIIGAISPVALESPALQAFINESNRGERIWFLDHAGDLGRRLQAPIKPA